jgi:predicted MPP superfamily phosphohydrolase
VRRIALPLLIITTIVGLLHWFIYAMSSQSFLETPIWLAVLLTIGVFYMPGAMMLSMTSARKRFRYVILGGYIWMGIFTIAFFFSFVQMFLLFFTVSIHSAWVLIATAIISLWALRINIFGPQVITHKMQGPDKLKGLRLLQISDLHVGMPTLREAWLTEVVTRINHAKPDIVVVTGDLVDAPYDETSPLLSPLTKISVPKFYVTGNHEYIRGGDWEARLHELGFNVLHNSHKIISHKNAQLLIAGVPDRRVNRFNKKLESNPDLALKTSEKVDYKILLAHEPSSVFDIQSEKSDLILSGHTHGGQIFPFGLFVRLDQPVVSGFKMIKGFNVFAHQGTGFWGPPMRWFTRSEIVVFEWS